MTSDFELLAPAEPPRRWPLVIAIAAAVLWLLATLLLVAMAVPGLVVPPQLAAAVGVAGGVLMLLAPLAVIVLVALRLRDRSGMRAFRTAMMVENIAAADRKLDQGTSTLALLEDRLAALADRIETVAAPIAAQHESLVAATGRAEVLSARLAEVGTATEAAIASLGSATPAAVAQAQSLLAMIETASTTMDEQLGRGEALLARLHENARAADTAAAAASSGTIERIAALKTASDAAQSAIAAPLAQLADGVETAFARTAAAMDVTRDGIHAQTSAMLASVEQARVTLDHIGGESARQVDARLAALLATAGTLGSEIEVQTAQARALIDDVARGFTILDAKLGNSATTSTTTLDAIAARMSEAREAIFRLGEPLAATDAALASVAARMTAFGETAAGTLGALDVALPAAMPTLEDMAVRLSELHDRADQLSLPLQSGGESLAAAQVQLDRARESLESAAGQLGTELAAARDALAEIDAMTGTASLAASSQLIDVFARVREIANQTAGTMRETLSNVVAEAEAALDQAGTSRAEIAFNAPIRASLAEVEVLHDRVTAAGQAAAERVTRRLLSLVETVAGVENRIDEVDTRFDIRSREGLTKRAGNLLGSLNKASIDIAGLLAFDIEDTAWENYLTGDRSVFARRIAALLDGDGTRAIARHFDHDPEFRNLATHFIDDFEALIGHVLPDREGHPLATTLLTSHVGRLYVALGQSISRFG